MIQWRRYLAWIAVAGLTIGLAPLLSQAQQSSPAAAPDSPTTSSSSEFAMREWLIIACDAYQARANGIRIRNTLPKFVDSLRPDPAEVGAVRNLEPIPLGVIRFSGRSDASISVRIKRPGATFRGTWPPAAMRPGEAFWEDIQLANAPILLRDVDQDHWFNTLRGGNSSFINRRGNSERFLLYDLDFLLAPPLKLMGGSAPDEPIDAVNTSAESLKDLVLYSKSPTGWRRASLSQTLSPATAPSDSMDMKWQPASFSEPAEVLGDWKKRLEPWSFEDCDLNTILRILAAYALDPNQITAVYLLDDAQVNHLLPIQVNPPPRSIRRAGIVILKSIDPNLPAIIQRLIAELGDSDWKTREAASAALMQIGPAAEGKLRVAVQNPDPEIANRASDIVAAIGPSR